MSKGDEHLRLANKVEKGCEFFISQAVYNAQATIDLHTHFFKAVQLGPTTVEAWVIRAGKSVAFAEAKLYDLNGELAARATSSSKLRPFTGLQYDPKAESASNG